MGARVIARVHREKGLDFVAGLGADVVLPLDGDWSTSVRK